MRPRGGLAGDLADGRARVRRQHRVAGAVLDFRHHPAGHDPVAAGQPVPAQPDRGHRGKLPGGRLSAPAGLHGRRTDRPAGVGLAVGRTRGDRRCLRAVVAPAHPQPGRAAGEPHDRLASRSGLGPAVVRDRALPESRARAVHRCAVQLARHGVPPGSRGQREVRLPPASAVRAGRADGLPLLLAPVHGRGVLGDRDQPDRSGLHDRLGAAAARGDRADLRADRPAGSGIALGRSAGDRGRLDRWHGERVPVGDAARPRASSPTSGAARRRTSAAR